MDGLLRGYLLKLVVGETTIGDLKEALKDLPTNQRLSEETELIIDVENDESYLELCFDGETHNDISLPL